MARKKKVEAITPLAYWQKHGIEHCERLCIAAGTSYDYWKRICNLRARPSADLARKLVALTGGELSMETLLPPREQLRGSGAPPIPGGNKVGNPQRRIRDGAILAPHVGGGVAA